MKTRSDNILMALGYRGRVVGPVCDGGVCKRGVIAESPITTYRHGED